MKFAIGWRAVVITRKPNPDYPTKSKPRGGMGRGILLAHSTRPSNKRGSEPGDK
jgi:hypothetical protein